MIPQIDPTQVETIAQNDYDCISGTPWEKVGSKLTNGANVKQTLVEAGLDWEVVKRPAWVDITPTGLFDEKTLAKGGSTNLPLQPVRVKGNYVMLRSDTMEPVSPFVGPRYKPIQNEDAFEVFRDFCEAGNMTLETAGSLLGGEHIWGLAKIAGDHQLCNGEYISGYFLLMQSHIYGRSLRALFTPVRYPGGHMIVQAVNRTSSSNRTYTMPHSRHFNEDRITEIKEVMGVAQKVLADFVEDARRMADTPVGEQSTIRYFVQLFHPKLYNLVLDGQIELPEYVSDLATWEHSNMNLRRVPNYLEDYAGSDLSSCNGTTWGLVQATNHYYDHCIGRSPDTRLVSTWMGQNARDKLKAMANIKQL